MDRPQYQVPQQNPSYRFMRYPLPKGPLQELYPGRVIDPNWHFTGDNIPAPEGFQQTRNQLATLSKDAAFLQESMNRQLGGINPIFEHASIEPENPIELGDPVIITANEVGTRGRREGSFEVESDLPSTNRNYVKGGVDEEKIQANLRSLPRDIVNTRYGWKAPALECYDGNAHVANSPVTGGGINYVFIMVLVAFAIFLFIIGFRLKPLLKLK